MLVYVNGSFVPKEQAVVPIEDRGYQYADGVYEVAAIVQGTLVDADLHFKRLEYSLREIDIDNAPTTQEIKAIIVELMARENVQNDAIYIQITRGVAPRNHPFPNPKSRPSVIIYFLGKPLQFSKDSMHIVTLPDQRWARRDIKSISLLPNIMAKQQAVQAGAGEAWLVEEDIITEGTSSNAFIIKDNMLQTHPKTQRILGGIVRERIIEIAAQLQLDIVEKPFTVVQAKQASEAFGSSSTMGIKAVSHIDNQRIGNGAMGDITRKIQEAYKQHVTT